MQNKNCQFVLLVPVFLQNYCMAELKEHFGKRLKYLRESKKLTQEQFAEKIDISSRALSSIECGKMFVTAETIEKICRALEINPKTLFDFDFQYAGIVDAKKELLHLIDKNESQILKIRNIVRAFLG